MNSISILERENSGPNHFPGKNRVIGCLKDPVDIYQMSKGDYDDILSEARKNILEDEKLLELLLKAIVEKLSHNPTHKFARIENMFVEKCIDLQDADIDNIIRQLETKFIQFLNKQSKNIDLRPKTFERLKTIGSFLDAKGIKSTIHFIRERIKLLKSRPTQKFILGFNDVLDASRKIDLIEMIFDGEDVDQLNLIQIKSNNATAEAEKETIIEEHRKYVKEAMLPLKEIENTMITQSDRETFEATIKDQARMFEALFDICVEYKKQDNQSLIEMLGLGKLSKLQAFWILKTYLDTITTQIREAENEGYITKESADDLIDDLVRLTESLRLKTGTPNKIRRVRTINSIISVGPKIIAQTEIYSGNSGNLTAV